jgi:uncharacterized membrane protein YidH (DUF202 family)
MALYKTAFIIFMVTIISFAYPIWEMYQKWINETNTPILFKNNPYLPIWILIGMIILVVGIFIWFRLEDRKLQMEQKEIEQRIENLEKILK